MLRSHRSRGGLSVVLVVLATAFALTGGVALYVRQEIVTSGAFADRATGALERDAVRRVVSREIVVQLIDRGSTDLISARPVVESVVDFVVASEPFRRVFRRAALEANRVLFVRDEGNVAVDIGDAGTVVASALRSVAPDLARKIPPDADAKLLELQQRSFATKTLRFADSVRLLGLVLPALAVLGYALAIVVAPDRRAAVTRAGIAIGAAAALLLIALLALRTAVVARAPGKDELTDKEVGEAVRAIWDAYLRDLSEWALAIGAVALLVAAASASLLRPFSAERSLARLRTRLRPPETAAWRAARGVALLAVGVFVVFDPGLALEILAVVAGALLVYCGAGEALSAIQPAGRAGEQAARRGARRGVLVAGGVIVATVAGLGIWIAAGGSGREAEAGLPRRATGTSSCATAGWTRSRSPAVTTRCLPPTAPAGCSPTSGGPSVASFATASGCS